jgi:hypothetical protein
VAGVELQVQSGLRGLRTSGLRGPYWPVNLCFPRTNVAVRMVEVRAGHAEVLSSSRAVGHHEAVCKRKMPPEAKRVTRHHGGTVHAEAGRRVGGGRCGRCVSGSGLSSASSRSRAARTNDVSDRRAAAPGANSR